MKYFTNQDIADYYDHTEVHYKMWWKFEETLGLHYAIWDKTTQTLAEAILNTNTLLAQAGEICSSDYVLDAGCGVGGSAIYLANKYGCRVKGVTLSKKQADTATKYAAERGVSHLVSFEALDYNFTGFPDNSFDVIWGIESIQTTYIKENFFREARRILKPGGRLLVSDYFKPVPYKIDDTLFARVMLHGWAICDISTLDEFLELGKAHGFTLVKNHDVNRQIFRSALILFLFAFPGTLGTWFYNWFVKKATYFSRQHYKTYYAQFISYLQGRWKYKHLLLKKE